MPKNYISWAFRRFLYVLFVPFKGGLSVFLGHLRGSKTQKKPPIKTAFLLCSYAMHGSILPMESPNR